MRKNVAGQNIGAQLNSKTTGDPVTTGTTIVYVTGDGGTQAAGGGTVTHEGQGWWNYAPTQAETNYNHVSFTFVNSAAVTQSAQTYPVAYDPSDATRLGLSALPNAAAAANGGIPTVDSNNAVKLQSGTGANQISLASGLVTVGTNNDKTGYGLANAAITSSVMAASGVLAIQSGLSTLDAAGVRSAVGMVSANLDTQLDAIPTAIENADALLKRDWTLVTGEASRSVLNALRFLRNKWSILVSTLTVTKEDDTTAAWQATVTSNPSADPIVGSDPT